MYSLVRDSYIPKDCDIATALPHIKPFNTLAAVPPTIVRLMKDESIGSYFSVAVVAIFPFYMYSEEKVRS